MNMPKQVIIFDRDLGNKHPNEAFYLRIQDGNDVYQVNLPGSASPFHARTKAQDLGYSPTHWKEVGKNHINAF